MTDGAHRARSWREQRTARGVCHGPRCSRSATGYLCEYCRRKTSPQAAEMMRIIRGAKWFLRAMELLSAGLCVDCEEPYRDPRGRRWRCPRCRKGNVSVQRGEAQSYL